MLCCDSCGLGQDGLCLPAAGNPRADVMLVGDYPGPTDAVSGFPYAGAGANDILQKCLEYAELDQQEIWITNLVKCAHADNHAATMRDIEYCAPFLQIEIEEIRPRLLILAGARVITWFQTKAGLTKLERGVICSTSFPIASLIVCATYSLRAPLRVVGERAEDTRNQLYMHFWQIGRFLHRTD